MSDLRAGIPRLPASEVRGAYRVASYLTMYQVSELGRGGSLDRCHVPSRSFDQGMYWGLFIIEDLQAPPLLQQLYPMRIIGMRSADWRRHYQLN